MLQALVLNSSYEYLNIISSREALENIVSGRYYVVEEYEQTISSPSVTFRLPAVVAVKHYVKVKYDYLFGINWNPTNLKLRDAYVCQYCGNKLHRSKATVEHVLPESRGGLSTWENTVCACGACNGKKRNRTPEEAGMKLIRVPKQPRGFKDVINIRAGQIHELWLKYLKGYLKD